ncbi:hypothetical protein FHK92_15420 [Pseudomonas brassicacearum subsp. neoaurantiaca]|uniref:Uncharacterized protein n=1 Tax=Pseudomonas brassicacearum subsp. neoaurantiaca TaxID=494916 RepID=A0A7V8RME2_9PSED|nr:hypothetical protein [Pseudomonas brassicacearum subsp. neoaurantiaca]
MGHKPGTHPQSLWERACSRRRRHSQHQHQLSHRFREQARSHIGFPAGHKTRALPHWISVLTNPADNPIPCGSELARDDGGTANISIN